MYKKDCIHIIKENIYNCDKRLRDGRSKPPLIKDEIFYCDKLGFKKEEKGFNCLNCKEYTPKLQ
jgi:hypothetical protein